MDDVTGLCYGIVNPEANTYEYNNKTCLIRSGTLALINDQHRVQFLAEHPKIFEGLG